MAQLVERSRQPAETVLPLVITVHFNATWTTKLEHQATRPADFELLTGTRKSLPTTFKVSLSTEIRR